MTAGHICFLVTGPGDRKDEDFQEVHLDERSGLLRALEWGGDDLVEAETLPTEALRDRLSDLIDTTGEMIGCIAVDMVSESVPDPVLSQQED